MYSFIGQKQRVSQILIVFTWIMTLSSVCFAQFGGGAGTADSPYQIATAAHLNAIRAQFLAVNVHFIQTANINLGEAPWNEGAGWQPIGDNAVRFQGIFNGNEFVITGLTINRNQQYQGLFGYTSGATLRNITLAEVEVVNSGQDSGTLVGRADNTRVEGCVSAGSLNSSAAGRGAVGGMIGYYSGQMTRCKSFVDVTARNANSVGGMIGDSWGNISDSFAAGNIIGNDRVGGLCGNDYNGLHERVLARGNVEGNNEVGGLYGFVQTARYNDCYATGNVQGNNQVGGLIGHYNLPANVNQQLHRGYSVGAVSGNEEVGGLIGRLRANIPGPFHSYWNIETSEQDESPAGEGLTTLEMLEQESFVEWNFGANGPWRMDPGSYPYLAMEGDQAGEHNYPTEILPPRNFRYVIAEERDEIRFFWNEPTLLEPIGYNFYRDGERLNEELLEERNYTDTDVEEWTPYVYGLTALYIVDEEIEESNPAQLRVIITNFAEGDGSADNPYTISSASQLNRVRNLLNAHFIQTGNIDLAGEEWQAIGTEDTPFTGGFNGDEFTISGLTIETEEPYQGLFGFAAGARLTDLTLENVDVTGGDYVGALAGRADNVTIEGCSAEGTVTGTANVGGLIGYFSGSMIDSYAHTNVQGTANQVGGLVGDSWGMLERCYATGDVTGVNLVGGLAGISSSVGVSNCFAVGSVTGGDEVGGLLGKVINTRLSHSYATGNVSGRSAVGGLLGTNASRIHYTYSIGRVTGQDNVGGLIGRETNAVADRCYWNTITSGQENSAGGEGRDERHMTYPYTDDTFVEWDFQRVWVADEENNNRGYPYLEWQPLIRLPYPNAATTPFPAHIANGVAVELDELRWTYIQAVAFTDPVGFRVYFNSTGEFGEDDDFEWVAFDEAEENYSCADILPEHLDYRTTYFWKVVPTTIDPNDDGRGDNRSRQNTSFDRESLSLRNDAVDVPVWRFTTQANPVPTTAHSPNPEDETEDVEVTLANLRWSFTINQDYANPAGFRVYFNDTGEFGEDDDFHWVVFSQHQTNYLSAALLPEELNYNTTYYWKVVPTTTVPNRSEETERRRMRNGARALKDYRLDAEDVDVWSFTTLTANPNPQPATNPDPEHLATGIPVSLTSVSWDYIPSDIYTDPVGFRVYMNTTGAFGVNAPYVWVDYAAGEETYTCMEVVPAPLDTDRTYFWRVVPTTIHPDDRSEGRNRNSAGLERSDALTRGDAQNSPVWRFTTGTTDVGAIHELPLLTELQRNYPNPFNPETTISFSLAEAGEVVVEVYNSRGQQIVTLVDGILSAGAHNVIWNGRDSNNQEVGSGIYFYRMKSGSYTSTNKMILLR